MREIKSRWEKERLEWREGCDSLQIAHRVAHLRIAVELEKEKGALIVEREVGRKERLGRLQRDNRLLMFQIEESNKEARVAQLESELARTRSNHQSQLQSVQDEYRKKLEAQHSRCKELESQLEEKVEELEGVFGERAQLEVSHLIPSIGISDVPSSLMLSPAEIPDRSTRRTHYAHGILVVRVNRTGTL